MKSKYIDFLGLKSKKFESEYCSVSVVRYEQPVSEEWHCHRNFHFSAILLGGNKESRKKEDIQVTVGKLLIYREGEIHRNRFTCFPSKNLNIEIKPYFITNYTFSPKNSKSEQSNFAGNYFNLIKLYYELLVNDQYTPDSIHSTLMTMVLDKERAEKEPNWLIKRAKAIIHDHWDEFISLDTLAYELKVHPVTISKYFQKYYGCTLSDYMRKIKVEKALQLINHSSKSLSEIAYLCGFSDQSHMIRLFKYYLG